jgi:pyruvate dehydrogenase E1 component
MAAGAGAVSGSCKGHLATLLLSTHGPVIAATDYVRAVPESVRAFVPQGRHYSTLGTDGFGRSDTRAALRRFFAVDADSIAQAAMRALVG